ncbi:MAG: hypothetical protein J1F69_00235 [Clostridiales bacterium]|nr:hypothetical protein [Clostridiales bacterium]
MSNIGRRIIRAIILINPLLFGLQDKIEKEQEAVIADMTSPADKIVKKLIELDNRRIDLCNLKVLYGFIERGLGEKFELLRSCAFSGINCNLYTAAERQIELAGYTAERAEKEFSYLFKLLKHKGRIKKVMGGTSFMRSLVAT